jgi:Domain of unknown function (DUF4402)
MRPAGRAIFRSALKTALIAAICLGPALAARAATLAGAAEVAVVTPLSIVKTEDLRFGAIIPGAAAGTVTISNTTGARTSSGPLTLVGTGFGRAEFLGLGSNSFAVLVTRTGPLPVLTRVGGGASMNVTAITGVPAVRFFPGAGVITHYVGGTLAVGASQMPGFYTGTFNITMTYF